MIRRITENAAVSLNLGETPWPPKFPGGLEYSSPARGTWNIVHVGMLLPEAHLIFVCAEACLRGVVLTAAEMGAMDRFSMINIHENDITSGGMETLIIDGVGDILSRLEKKPRAVLLYTSCVHHFIGCDLPLVYKTLRENHPEVDIINCYMNPIMRKSGLTPDQLMRKQLYAGLKAAEHDPKKLIFVGNDFPTPEGELRELIGFAGFSVSEIQDFSDYDGYLSMGKAPAAIIFNEAAKPAGNELKRRLGIETIYLPYSWDYAEIRAGYEKLAGYLGVHVPDYSSLEAECEAAAARALRLIGDTPVAIDYTLTYKPIGLAYFLASRGFNVKRIYGDGYSKEEQASYEKLSEIRPDIELWPTVNVMMRKTDRAETDYLALGQKAAYFLGTDRFVNIVENDGLYGFGGIIRLMALMEDAYKTPKDTKKLVQIKGWGCGGCL